MAGICERGFDLVVNFALSGGNFGVAIRNVISDILQSTGLFPDPRSTRHSESYDNATNRITTAGYQYDVNGNTIRFRGLRSFFRAVHGGESGNQPRNSRIEDANGTKRRRSLFVRHNRSRRRWLGLGSWLSPTVRDSYPPFDPVSRVSWFRFHFLRCRSARKHSIPK